MNISKYTTDKPLRRDQSAKGRDLYYFALKIKALEDTIVSLKQQLANMNATLGGEDLATTLAAGNSTGGNDIVVSTGDQIIGQTDLLMGESTGDSYYYASIAYIFQQWYDGLGTGNTDFLLQGSGTQMFSHTAIDIQCDTGLYGFYEGTSFSGTLDFRNLSANRSYTVPDAAGTFALLANLDTTIISVNSTPYTVIPTSGNTIYLVDATAGNITMNFPSAIGSTAIYGVKKIDATANTVILTPDGAETIDGAATKTITAQWQVMNLFSDNVNLFLR